MGSAPYSGRMELLYQPEAWLAFLVLTALEIILGLDNIVFLAMLVDRLPQAQRPSARVLGLAFAMLTRLALLFVVVWLTAPGRMLGAGGATYFSARAVILLGGGLFLIVGSLFEIRRELAPAPDDPAAPVTLPATPARLPGLLRYWFIILQVGILDIVFSVDSVFTAVGLANRIEIMAAAIVVSILIMMLLATAVGAMLERYPTLKILALAYLVLVGFSLVGDALGRTIPKHWLYLAMGSMTALALLRIRRDRE